MVTVQEIVEGAFDPGEALRLLASLCDGLVRHTESLERRVAELEARAAAAAGPAGQPAAAPAKAQAKATGGKAGAL